MIRYWRTVTGLGLWCAKVVLCAGSAFAQDGGPQAAAKAYPERPIRMVLPYPPGGNTDILARAVAQRMTESWGKTVVIDPRGGASGVIASEIVARSNADGYTVFVGSTREISVNPILLDKVPYDVDKDFAPVTQGTISPILAAAHPTFAPKSIKEVIALAKANPKALSYASPGIGTSQHLTGELFNLKAGVKSLHVAYKGGGPSVLAVMSGEVKYGYLGMGPAIPHVKAGRLKALALTTAKRSDLLPDVPTMQESGLKDFETSIWFAFFVPAKTPKAVIAKLNAELVRILKSKEVNDFLVSTGVEVAPGTPGELAATIRQDAAKYREIIKVAGVRPE
ncbi:MAG: tripartite tricarboxylate transporter substrate binding protein [Pseudomonadota bacterium]